MEETGPSKEEPGICGLSKPTTTTKFPGRRHDEGVIQLPLHTARQATPTKPLSTLKTVLLVLFVGLGLCASLNARSWALGSANELRYGREGFDAWSSDYRDVSNAKDPFTSPPDASNPLLTTSFASTVLSSTPLTALHDLCEDLASKWYRLRETSVYLHHYRPPIGYEDNGKGRAKKVYRKRELDQTQKIEAGMIPVLVLLSGMFAGLTLGYFSVDPTQLQVLSISGTPKQQEYARKILPVRKNGHLLLTTLLILNMIVNEALPVVADGPLGGGIIAVVVSTVLVVIFAEIIPQSVCSRFGLFVGAKMAWPVKIAMVVFSPICWPVAKLLEYVLGAHHGIVYRRSELRELIKFHAADGQGGGDLDLDTVTMAQGALGLQDKTVKDAMTPIDSVFMLPIEAKLDYETLGQVVRSGHSRIPVYQMVEVPDVSLPAVAGKTRMVRRVLGSLLVKSCVLLDPEDATPLSSVPLNAIPSVPWDEPLTHMLNAFQEGRSHMAIVSRRAKYKPIEDDTESIMSSAAVGMRKRFLNKITEKVRGGDSSGSDEDDTSPTRKGADVELGETAKKPKAKDSKDSSFIPKLQNQEQALPADAQLGPEGVERFFEGLEGAPLGLITLEDVIEELIGEEIFDEYDPPSETGQPSVPASTFMPAEAMEAAQAAAKRREAEASESTVVNEKEGELATKTTPTTGTGRRLPRLTVPSFAGIKRAVSTPPIRKETESKATPNATPPTTDTPPPSAPAYTAEPSPMVRSHSSSAIVTAEPENLEQILENTSSNNTAVADHDDRKIEKQVSFENPAAAQANPSTRHASLEGRPRNTVPAAVPARLLAGTGAVQAAPGAMGPPAVPALASLSTPLSEALLIERGRRRMAAAGGVPATLATAGRTASTGAIVRPVPSPAVPSPATPVAGNPPVVGASPAAAATEAGILSPVPRKARFKSQSINVGAQKTPPTSVPGTPANGESVKPLTAATPAASVEKK